MILFQSFNFFVIIIGIYKMVRMKFTGVTDVSNAYFVDLRQSIANMHLNAHAELGKLELQHNSVIELSHYEGEGQDDNMHKGDGQNDSMHEGEGQDDSMHEIENKE